MDISCEKQVKSTGQEFDMTNKGKTFREKLNLF